MDTDIESKGLGISELLDKIMEEEEKKSKKKENDFSNGSSKLFETNNQSISSQPTISVRKDIIYPGFSNMNTGQISAMSPGSNIIPQQYISPGRPIAPIIHPLHQNSAVLVHNESNTMMHGIPPSNGMISNPYFDSYNPPPPAPIQNVECYGKHCAAIFEPPTSVQNNFPLPQQYPELNTTNVPFPVPPKPNPVFIGSPGNRYKHSDDKNEVGCKNKFSKKRRKRRHDSSLSFTPVLPPPPSPPKLLKLVCDSQAGCASPRPFTPPMRPHTPTEPRPFTPPELPISPQHCLSNSSYINYPRTPPHDSYMPHSPMSNKPPEPLEPPPVSPEIQDYDIENSRTSRTGERNRKWSDSDENLDDNVRNESEEFNQDKYLNRTFHSKRNFRGRYHNNFNNFRGQNHRRHRPNYMSKNAYHRNNGNRGHPFTPLGVRFPVQGERPPFNPMGGNVSFNPFGECPPPNSGNHNPTFPIMEGMPFPPPGVVFNNINNEPSFNPSGGPPFEPPFMGERSPFMGPGFPPNAMKVGSVNAFTERPPNNLSNEPSYKLIEQQPYTNDYPDDNEEYPFEDKWSPDQKSSRNSKRHKNVKKDIKKKKSHKDSDQSENSNHEVKIKSSKVKHTKSHKREEERKLRIKKKKCPNYELEPGEYISESDLEDGSFSTSDESSSESESSYSSSSSSSTDTEDSLYKLEFLKKRKPRITRYDKLSDNDSDQESKIDNDKNVDKPKYPRYFKDKVAYADDISVSLKDGKETLSENKILSLDEPLITNDESKRPPSPPISSESLKMLKTPLIKRLGLAENKRLNEVDDIEKNENADAIKPEEDQIYPSCSSYSNTFTSYNDNTDTRHTRSESSLDFEEFRQRSNSLSPNNSLDFEEYKLLASTKEILSASKSIFKSPTSPKATTTKKYEKPIIKVETVSKPSPIKLIKESPQRIDLDSRIKLMFGMKSCGDDNSPEKKNFRNAAFSCKNMRLLSRPPSPFRSKNAYQFWHRETYYFRKNNPIPDVFFDPTQKRKIEYKISELFEDEHKFSNVKPDYYQINSIEDHQTKDQNETLSYTDMIENNDDITLTCKREASQVHESFEKHIDENLISSSSATKSTHDLKKSVTKLDFQSDTEIELVSKQPEEKLAKDNCDNLPNFKGNDSDIMVQLIVQKLIDELKNDIKEKLTEHLINEKFEINDIFYQMETTKSVNHNQLHAESTALTMHKENEQHDQLHAESIALTIHKENEQHDQLHAESTALTIHKENEQHDQLHAESIALTIHKENEQHDQLHAESTALTIHKENEQHDQLHAESTTLTLRKENEQLLNLEPVQSSEINESFQS